MNQPRPTLAVWQQSAGMSDTQLAAAAGISVDVLRKAKRGARVSRPVAEAICSALGVSLADVVDLNYR